MKRSALAFLIGVAAISTQCTGYLDFHTLSGAGGTGGVGGTGGGLLCSPGEMRSCYTGPAGTENKGICKAGLETCANDGMSFGPCLGEVHPAVEDCATPADEDCDGNAPACKGEVLWAKSFGDGLNQEGTGIAVDSSGNVLVAGYFNGSINLGGSNFTSAGNLDAFVAKLSPSGDHVWSRSFGDGADQVAQSITTDAAGNVIITGYFAGTIDLGGGTLTSSSAQDYDVFIAKLDPDGNHLWSRRFGDTASQGSRRVVVDPAGDVILAGSFDGTVDFGGGSLESAGGTTPGGTDIFLVKLDGATGGHVWSKRFGDEGDQRCRAVTIDASGNLIITGRSGGTVDFGGGPLVSTDTADVYVAKLDAMGNHLWSKVFGGTSDQVGQWITADASGNVVVIGTMSGTVDFGGGSLTSKGGADIFLLKLDPSGAHLWSKRFGDVDPQLGEAVEVDSGGNILITGSFGGQIDFGGGPLAVAGGLFSDIFVAKFGADGEHVWSKRFGDSTLQDGRSITVDAMGDVLLLGRLQGTVDFSGNVLTSAGGDDLLVMKLAP